MNKSKTSLEPTSRLPLVQDAANPCSTKIDKPSLPFEVDVDVVLVLLSIIDGLTYEFLSGDAWFLALSSAERRALELDIPNEKVPKILRGVSEHRKKRSSKNPMSSLF